MQKWSAVLVGAALVVGTTAISAPAGAQNGHSYYFWGTFAQHTSGSSTPETIAGVPGKIIQISGSDRDMYALTSAGTVYAIGSETNGALGNDTSGMGFDYTPVEVQFPANVTITSLPSPMPQKTGMAIDSKGDVWYWGASGGGDLCSTKVNQKVPIMVTAPQLVGDVTLASGQNNHSIFYTSSGTLYACGRNTAGELGDGTTTSSITPVKVVGLPDEQIVAVGTAWENSGALLADGTYYDWGWNTAGQLGNGTTTASDVPVEVNLPASVTTISEGGSLSDNGQTVAVLSNGEVYSWGTDQYGQDGEGFDNGHEASPVLVQVPAGVSFVSVNSGGASEYAIDSTGNVWSWGQNNEGQLGIGSTQNQDVPTSVGLDASQVFSTAFDVVAFS
jgi:alpha-tubulin suppressor-like RCC1 family protein